MDEFLQRLESKIQSRGLLPREQKILVAVSGGADSMVLLYALDSLAKKLRWKISIAHFNHQLRGRSSDADEQLVRKTTKTMKLPFVVECADVKSFAQKSKISIEMAARKLRHEFFARIAREREISTVALAHHADDQVELFFLRLLRGAGGAGLAGMKWRAPSPANPKITLIRPLLDFSKTELLRFARENKIRFREDATNFLLGAKRNRIRNELLPMLHKNYQPGLAQTVLRSMEIVGAESDVIESLAKDWLKQRRPDFKKLPVAIQRRVVQSQLERSNVAMDFELIERLRKSAEKLVSAGSGLFVSRDADGGGLKLREQQSAGFNANKITVKLTGRAGEMIFAGIKFIWNFDSGSRERLPRQKEIEFFDASKIGSKIILRHWCAGDRFQPIGLESAAKLQDLFTNAKIPRDRRRGLIVAAAAGGIFWVEGLRISENFKLTPETKRLLVWRWQRL